MRALQLLAAFVAGAAVAMWVARMRAAAKTVAGLDTSPDVAAAETPSIGPTAIQGIVPLDYAPTAAAASQANTEAAIAAATGGALVGSGASTLRLFA